jgi:hypothetical protein
MVEKPRQKNCGRKTTIEKSQQKKCGKRIAETKPQQQNRERRITAVKPQNHDNITTIRGSKILVADLEAAKSWQFFNHVIFSYWNCSNCCMVWYRS